MAKKRYIPLSCDLVDAELQSSILSGSIVDTNATLVIPRGQKVDEYDFSSAEFSQEWNIEESSK